MTNIKEAALKGGCYFESGYYCAESVVLAVTKELKLESEFFPKIATGFCSGFARTSGPCGAVTGAILAISIVYGRNTPDESVDDIYETVQELIKKFEKKHGSSNCFELTGCDLGTQSGHDKFEDQNLKVQCKKYVEDAVRFTLKSLNNK